MKIKILTDTSCGILREEAERLGYEMIALPFVLDDKEYDDDKIIKADFYAKLKEAKEIHTSQASMETVMNYFDKILSKNDFIIYLPITSGLSSAYANAVVLADEEKYKNKVIVIDHKTISVLQRQMLRDVVSLLEKGIELSKIKELIEENAKNNRIYIAVDTLDYLKKGGRVSVISAAVGNLLNIKPILFSNGGKFSVVKKARGIKAAEEEIKNLIRKDYVELFSNEPIENFTIGVAYTDCMDEAEKFREMMSKEMGTDVVMDELPSILGCHIGSGAVASAIYKHVR